jgi:hypothetical protein
MRVHDGGRRALVAALMVVGLSCSGQDKTVKFDGLLTLDDQPLTGAMVEFIPMEGQGRPATGLSNKEGVFRLTTFSANDGALPGFYKVVVTKDSGGDDSTPRQPTNKAEAMELYIKKGKAMAQGQAQARRKLPFPAMYSNPAKTPLRCTVPPDGKAVVPLQSSS